MAESRRRWMAPFPPCAWAGLSLTWSLAQADPEALPPYQLDEIYVGPDFFEKWDFWSDADPTHGQVRYVASEVAHAEGLVLATKDHAYIGVDRVDRVAPGGKRQSVRIQSKATYNRGLFIVDIEHMPYSCGAWPAFWMYGDDAAHPWPTWGEFDIIETLHKEPMIFTTLHTGPSCMQASIAERVHFSQTWDRTQAGGQAVNCDVTDPSTSNQGCSQRGREASAGQDFNSRGGGTFAGEWDPDVGHIRTWFWPDSRVPQDVRDRKPDPETWGMPDSYFSLAPEACQPGHFRDMRMVFNIALCGDLGNPTFRKGPCYHEAKNKTCQEFVRDPAQMSEVFWLVRRLDTYSRVSAGVGGPSNPIFMVVIALLSLGTVAVLYTSRNKLAKMLGLAKEEQPPVETRFSFSSVANALSRPRGDSHTPSEAESRPRAASLSELISRGRVDSAASQNTRTRADSAGSITSLFSDWSTPQPPMAQL